MSPVDTVRQFFATLSRSVLGLVGAAITTASAVLILSLFGLEIVGFEGGPYLGILAFLILPAIFVLGLVIIPIGVWRQRRKEARLAEAPDLPVLDFNRARVRRTGLIVLLLTLANIIILALATYKGVETMESTEFCGTTCHAVMQPEYTAYQASPHARVGCVECHIGPGAPWFVKSKLSGSWQVVSVTLDLYPRPIPSPIHNLRPARETCEQCHWPTKFVGDRLKVLPRYQEDEENTLTETVLLMKVGGIEGRESSGIHWHVDPSNEVSYLSDPSRETIYEVTLTRDDGSTTVFRGSEDMPEDGELERRVMDCVDCHNRPSHTFKLAEPALDEALSEGLVDPSLPWVSREGLRLLEGEYESHEVARETIPAELMDFYRTQYPQLATQRGDDIRRSGEELAAIWTRNVFPKMGVTWGTYPNHIGHQNTPGCFRCHDGSFESEDGQMIEMDCFTCHSLLAMEEEQPEILGELNP